MPTPTVSILLNSTTPAAPTGDQNVKPQTDGAAPLQSISFYPQKATASLRGTVKPDGTTTTVDGSGVISVGNIAESQVTGLVTDLAAKVPTSRTITTTAPLTGGGDLSANRTLAISAFTGDAGSGGAAGAVPAPPAGSAALGKFLKADGTFAVPAGGSTFGGDVATVDATHQKVVGLNTVPLDTSVTLIDGMTWQYNASSGKWLPVFDRATRPVSSVVGKPSAGQLVLIYTAEATETFPPNFTAPQSYGSLGVTPTATAVYTVFKNASNVGTVSISTSGVFTFTTTSGAAFTLNAGDRFTVVAPGTQDTTLSDVSITLVGTRGAVSASISAPPPVITWRGVYSGSTAYNLYDEVSYLGSSYICIAATTGNLPTNTSFWNLVAQAGANGTNGTTTAAQVQQEAFTYAADMGAANAYAITLSPAPTLAAGSRVQLIAAHANTGASTLAVNGGTATPIKKQVSTALATGDILANQMLDLIFDGTNWQMVSGGAASSGGGGLVFLEAHTASNSTELDFTSWYSSAYDNYHITVQALVPATNSIVARMQFSTNGGASYDTGNNYSAVGDYAYNSATNIDGSGGAAVPGIMLANGSTSNNANYGITGTYNLTSPGSTTVYKALVGHSIEMHATVGIIHESIGGFYLNTAAVNAFRIIMSSGNITSGIVRIYGVAH
jgi:hypothetical protein